MYEHKNTMTLGQFKAALKGRELYVWANWSPDDGAFLPVAKSSFLSTIGADVPFANDGLHDETVIVAHISPSAVYVG